MAATSEKNKVVENYVLDTLSYINPDECTKLAYS